MSVAFTREEDAESVAANLPDRPISPHANLVTPKGLSQIDEALAAAQAAYAEAQLAGGISSDRTAIARATRDLRYWSSRRASAQLTVLDGPADKMLFGRTVTLEHEDGRRQSWLVCGEDEANPATGSVSYVSPLARAALGQSVGDEITVSGQVWEIVGVSGA
jgi:transcription elongation GreA/GreB family factor